MTDLDRAIAAAREALKVKSHPLDSRVTKTLRDLLAALDAARGEAVPDGYTSFGEFRWACDCDERMKREWIPLYAAPPAAAVPEGYALVPVEPTEAMQDAAERCWEKWRNGNVTEEIWQAMLAAALAERNNTGDNP